MGVVPFYKDPDAVIPIGIDWSDYVASALEDLGVTLTVQEFQWPAVAGLTVTALSPNGDTAVAKIAGGTAGSDYMVTCRAVFDNGMQDDRSVIVKVTER